MKVYVRQGNTLWYYSQLFQVPLQLIIDSNLTINPNSLIIGDEIDIPGYVTINYQIQSGDTLWGVANKYKVAVDSLVLVNPTINPLNLQVGGLLNIPQKVTWSVVNGKQYYDYETMLNDINQLLAIYPFLRKTNIGNSVMGKAIPELVIGTGTKEVHTNGSFHANEWITTPIIMTFINDYLLSLTNQWGIRGLVLNPYYLQTTLSMVPMVNPDGVNLVLNGPPDVEPYQSQVVEINNNSLDFSNWKANIRGVDLNNQYPAKWELESRRKEQQPAPRDYPGPAPLSEPESIAIAELTGKRNFSRVLAFHTQGEVIFWGYDNLEPPVAQSIVNEFARVSGYRPIRFVDSYAGYKDWFIQEWRRPGYTVELGSGTNPLPLSQFDEIYQESLGIFLANLYL